MIVKVQLSQFTTGERQRVLAYDLTRKYRWEGDAPAEIVKLLAGRPKVYFHAAMRGTEIELDTEAPEQDW